MWIKVPHGLRAVHLLSQAVPTVQYTCSEAVYVVPEKMAELLHDYRLRQVVVSEEIDSIHFINILSHLCVIYVPDATFV